MAKRRAGGQVRVPLTRRRFVARLYSWHAVSERSLLIRDAATPWQFLVAEVMSHQTQIERVGPAWRRFIDTWPSPAALADAGTRDLLAAWAGLGYNRRALALREAARLIVGDHAGQVPVTVAELEALPGIGSYTARAVAATAFGVPVAPLDVNVRRVVSRVAGIDGRSREVQAAADALVDRRDPRRWLNAVMDLASGVCTKSAPQCGTCPLFGMCASRGETAGGRGPSSLAALPSHQPMAPWPPRRHVHRCAGGCLAPLPDQVGTHDRAAIAAAVESLEREGFLELRDGHARLRP